MNFLIVEDNLINRMVLQSLLEPVTKNLAFAENGAEALEAVEAGTGTGFQLILMDINMPVMDGVTATKEIRKYETHHGLPPTPIIAVTAHDDDEHRVACQSAGMDGFVAKPINADVLFNSINNHADTAMPA